MKSIILLVVSMLILGYFIVNFNAKFGRVVVNESALEAGITCLDRTFLHYKAYRSEDLSWTPNNIFGIYVYAEDEDYLELAQNLVNSKGGEWGYVLIPYNVKDRDFSKWNRVFQQLNSKKLVPIIQLWDVDLENVEKQTKEAAEFLNGFQWPIRDRYIVAYNEPNDSAFWYGNANPEQYARVLDTTITIFKEVNRSFFMMNAGFNTSAANTLTQIDAFDFMKRMDKEIPGIFDKLDGWSSHSYPQPNFSGNPHNVGRWSISAYATELDFLSRVLNVDKQLPVFITETGWAHAEGKVYNSSYLTAEEILKNFEIAYKEIWAKDPRVRAAIAFTLWYPPPYDHFAWVNQDKVPYVHYEGVKKLKKVAGRPPTLVNKGVYIDVCE